MRASNVGRTSVSVAWITDEASTKVVRPYHGLRDEALKSSLVVRHRITLSRLSPDTRYNCRVESKDEAGNLAASADLTFNTVC